jgi:hypothetical protein
VGVSALTALFLLAFAGCVIECTLGDADCAPTCSAEATDTPACFCMGAGGCLPVAALTTAPPAPAVHAVTDQSAPLPLFADPLFQPPRA